MNEFCIDLEKVLNEKVKEAELQLEYCQKRNEELKLLKLLYEREKEKKQGD